MPLDIFVMLTKVNSVGIVRSAVILGDIHMAIARVVNLIARAPVAVLRFQHFHGFR